MILSLDMATKLTSGAQSQSILVSKFFEALSTDSTLSSSLKAILWDLYRLFALYTMENEGYDCKVHYIHAFH